MSTFVSDLPETSELDELLAELTVRDNAEESVVVAASTVVEEEANSSKVTLISCKTDLERFSSVVKGQTAIAIDAEGVDLSRLGALTVFSVGIQVERGVHVFLFDMIHPTLREEQTAILKPILEDPSIEKIIHDCRQDSDALYRQFGITLAGVFDTSVYCSRIERSSKRVNLNAALKAYRCPLNENRDDIGSMYKANKRVWATRPLTPFLIEYASADVASSFELRDKLHAKVRAGELASISAASEEAVSHFRGMSCHEIVAVPAGKIGCVIGRGGANIDSIERRTGAFISCSYGNGFLVLAKNQETLNKARKAIADSYY